MAQSREGGEGAVCSKIWHLQPRPAYIPSHPTYTHHGAACASCIHAHDSCCNTVSSPMIIALPPLYGMTRIKPVRGPPKLTRLTSGSPHRWAQKHQVNPIKNKIKTCAAPRSTPCGVDFFRPPLYLSIGTCLTSCSLLQAGDAVPGDHRVSNPLSHPTFRHEARLSVSCYALRCVLR